MFRVLSIDPGNDAGWAFWEDGRIVAAGLGAPVSQRATPDLIIMEIPQVYPGGPKVNVQDLVTLAATAGRLLERVRLLESIRNAGPPPPSYGVFPRTWKGTLDKDTMVRRIQTVVGPLNQAHVVAEMDRAHVPTGKRHNVWDGVGLGHWAISQAMTGAKLGMGPVETLRKLCEREFRDL